MLIIMILNKLKQLSQYIGSLFRQLYRPAVIVILIVALIFRLVFLTFVADQLGLESIKTVTPDSQNYLNIAKDFLAGTDDAEKYLFTFGPGYPYFLTYILSLWPDITAPISVIQTRCSAPVSWSVSSITR